MVINASIQFEFFWRIDVLEFLNCNRIIQVMIGLSCMHGINVEILKV